jgi:hypothetical protein
MNFLEKIFENPGRVKVLKWIIYAVMAVLVVLDFFIHRHHEYFFWDKIPGFSSVYGFISCVLIIVVSKVLGEWWLQKGEDYYD